MSHPPSHLCRTHVQTGKSEPGWVVEEPKVLMPLSKTGSKRRDKTGPMRYVVALDSAPLKTLTIPPEDETPTPWAYVKAKQHGSVDAVQHRDNGCFYSQMLRHRGHYVIRPEHSEDELKEYKKLTEKLHVREAAACDFKTLLYGGDFRTLGEERCVNDNMVDFYIAILVNELNASNFSMMAFNSHFLQRLQDESGFLPTENASGHKLKPRKNSTATTGRYLRNRADRIKSNINWRDCGRWARRRDIFRRRLVLMPQFHPPEGRGEVGHWTIFATAITPGVVKVKKTQTKKPKKTPTKKPKKPKKPKKMPAPQPKLDISLYNSLVQNATDASYFSNLVRQFFDLKYFDTHGARWLKGDNISCHAATDTPQQHNGYDCGVHVCAVAYCLCHEIPLDSFATEEQIANFRVHMALSIYNGKLQRLIEYDNYSN